MPIAEIAGSTPGRVTRSLRKRLTSVDSDTSCRPATPVVNNLQAIHETVTPSKRVTRRTSLSTPIATPSKVSNTPGRRSTRRQSVLSQEQEDVVVQAKSKEPFVDDIKEEESAIKTPDAQNRRVTRSLSKSPLEVSTLKSKLDKKELTDKLSDKEEVIYISDEDDGHSPGKPKRQPVVMIKTERSIDKMLITRTTPSKENSYSDEKILQPESSTKKKAPADHLNTEQEQTEENCPKVNETTEDEKSSESVFAADVKSMPSNTASEPEKSETDSGEKNRSNIVELSPMKKQEVQSPQKKLISVNESPHSEEASSIENAESNENSKKLENSSGKGLQKKKLSLGQASPAKSPYKQGTPLNKSRPEKLKNVGFDDSIGDDSIKSVFPKTPGLTKSKSYILEKSKEDDDEDERNESLEKETSQQSVQKETSQKSLKIETSQKSVVDDKELTVQETVKRSETECELNDADNDEVHNTKTPYKLKLKAVESSTPIQSDSPKKNKVTEEEEPTEESAKINENPNDAILFPKSWSCSVSGTASEMPKIDKILPEENLQNKSLEKVTNKSQRLSSEGIIKDQNNVYDFDEDMEEEGEEEEYREKSQFVDDQAMEVPEGEESMDSEERAYLEENEIPIQCESIGSQDTDQEDDDDEPDDEDLAFVVSDSEDVQQDALYSVSEDEICTETSGKSYKRIIRMSNSSNEDVSISKTQSNNFKFNVGSSDDEELCAQDGNTRNKINIKSQSEISKEDTPNKGSQVSKKPKENENSARSLENDENLNKSRQKEISAAETEYDNKTQNKSMDVDVEKEERRSPKKARKSFNKSKQDVSRNLSASEDYFQEVTTQTTVSSYHNKSVRETDHDSEDDDKSIEVMCFERSYISEQYQNIGSPPKELNESKKIHRKSLNKSIAETVKGDGAGCVSPKDVKNKSMREKFDKAADEIEAKDEDPKTIGINISQDKKESRNSLNISKGKKRISLIRSSTDEIEENEQKLPQNKSLNKSKSNKSFPSLNVSTDPDEPPSSPQHVRKSLTTKSHKSSRKSQRSQSLSPEVDEIDAQTDLQNQGDEKETTDDVKLQRMSSAKNSKRQAASSMENSSSDDEEQEDEQASDSASSNDDDVKARFSEAEEEDQQKKSTERSMFMEFLGEDEIEPSAQPDLNSTRRSCTDKSKLDETFELDSMINSRGDNLHKSILRKSLMQNKLPIEEDTNQTDSEEDKSKGSANSSADEVEFVVSEKVLGERGLSVSLSAAEAKKKNKEKRSKKVLGERGLSVSLSAAEAKKKNKENRTRVHNSFTIGVSVRNDHSVEVKPMANSSSDSEKSDCDRELSEAEELEKVKNVHYVDTCKSNKSLSKSFKELTPDETKRQKKIKRTSLYHQEQDPSQSFIENIAEEKKKIESKRKRKSNSFCGVLAPAENENQTETEEVSSEKKQKSQPHSESENTTDIRHILERCDEILEAANHAKREAKLNANKSKVKKPKWMDKEERNPKEEEETKIPLVSRKEIKRKEKLKKELAKAIKHSTAMLTTIDPKLGKKLKNTQETEAECENSNNVVSTKRLPIAILDALEDVPKPKKKTKEIETTPPSDRENSKKLSNKQPNAISDNLDGKKKKKREPELLETAAGPVVVQPATPEKLRHQRGFRESPKTPAGFKIQNIRSAGQDAVDDKSRNPFRRKLYTSSGEFIEKDSSILSTAKAKKEKSRKRKREAIEEPVHCLPKTQWTTSGVFVEEDLFTARPLANSTATQFMVSSLNSNKKVKSSSKPVSAVIHNRAMDFKQNALFNNKVKRETSRELLNRKQRKLVNKHF